METVSIGPDDDMEARRADILTAIREVNSGDGVVLLTDMFGGTHSNLAISVMDEMQVDVVAGINLPMLIKLTSIRAEHPISEAINLAKEAGRKYINVASQVLSGDKTN